MGIMVESAAHLSPTYCDGFFLLVGSNEPLKLTKTDDLFLAQVDASRHLLSRTISKRKV